MITCILILFTDCILRVESTHTSLTQHPNSSRLVQAVLRKLAWVVDRKADLKKPDDFQNLVIAYTKIMKALDFERTKKAHDTPLPVLFPLQQPQVQVWWVKLRWLHTHKFWVSSFANGPLFINSDLFLYFILF